MPSDATPRPDSARHTGTVRFQDGIGVRRATADAFGEPIEQLQLCTDLAAMESAVRERVSRLINFRHVRYVRLRGCERQTTPDKDVVIAYDAVQGARVAELLDFASHSPTSMRIDIDSALQIVRELLPAIAVLHDSRNVTHGAIGPERLVVTPQGRLVIVDHGLGLALGKLGFSRRRYWQQLRVPVPQATGKVLFDARTDVVQIGMVALALVLGRPIGEAEFPQSLEKLIDGAKEQPTTGSTRPLSSELRAWLERALPLERRVAFATVREAQQEFEKLFSGKRYTSNANALKTLIARYQEGMGQGSQPAPSSSSLPLTSPPLSSPAPTSSASSSGPSRLSSSQTSLESAPPSSVSPPSLWPSRSSSSQAPGASSPWPSIAAESSGSPSGSPSSRTPEGHVVRGGPVSPVSPPVVAPPSQAGPMSSPIDEAPYYLPVERQSPRGVDARPSDPPLRIPGPSEETEIAVTHFADSVSMQPKMRTRPRRVLVTPIEDSIPREELMRRAKTVPPPSARPSLPGLSIAPIAPAPPRTPAPAPPPSIVDSIVIVRDPALAEGTGSSPALDQGLEPALDPALDLRLDADPAAKLPTVDVPVVPGKEGAPATKARISETKPAEPRLPESRAPESRAPETKTPVLRTPEPNGPEPKAPELRALESKAPATKAPQARSDVKGADARAADAQIADSKTATTRPADARPADARPANARTADAKVAGTKTVDAKTRDATPVRARTADTKTVDTKTVEAKLAEAKAALTKADAHDAKPVATKGGAAEVAPAEVAAFEQAAADTYSAAQIAIATRASTPTQERRGPVVSAGSPLSDVDAAILSMTAVDDETLLLPTMALDVTGLEAPDLDVPDPDIPDLDVPDFDVRDLAIAPPQPIAPSKAAAPPQFVAPSRPSSAASPASTSPATAEPPAPTQIASKLAASKPVAPERPAPPTVPLAPAATSPVVIASSSSVDAKTQPTDPLAPTVKTPAEPGQAAGILVPPQVLVDGKQPDGPPIAAMQSALVGETVTPPAASKVPVPMPVPVLAPVLAPTAAIVSAAVPAAPPATSSTSVAVPVPKVAMGVPAAPAAAEPPPAKERTNVPPAVAESAGVAESSAVPEPLAIVETPVVVERTPPAAQKTSFVSKLWALAPRSRSRSKAAPVPVPEPPAVGASAAVPAVPVTAAIAARATTETGASPSVATLKDPIVFASADVPDRSGLAESVVSTSPVPKVDLPTPPIAAAGFDSPIAPVTSVAPATPAAFVVESTPVVVAGAVVTIRDSALAVKPVTTGRSKRRREATTFDWQADVPAEEAIPAWARGRSPAESDAASDATIGTNKIRPSAAVTRIDAAAVSEQGGDADADADARADANANARADGRTYARADGRADADAGATPLMASGATVAGETGGDAPHGVASFSTASLANADPAVAPPPFSIVASRPDTEASGRSARRSRMLLHAGAGFLGAAAGDDDGDDDGDARVSVDAGADADAHASRLSGIDRTEASDALAPAHATRARRALPRVQINWRRTLAASLVVAALEGVAFATAYWYVTPTETGALLIETSPPGIEVLVDGRMAGRTSYSDTLPPGRHTIELRQGTASRVIPVEISVGVQTLQRITWSKGLKTGQARVTATAPNAHVTIDGRPLGKAPVTVSTLAAGKHMVHVESDSGTVTTPIAVSPGETTELDVPVYPGWVSVLSSVELFIFEGERFLGTTEGEKLLLSPGKHTLTFASETLGYRRALEVTVIPGATAAVSLPMPRVPATIDGPAGAELIVDGQSVGKLPLPDLTVPLGTRDFVFRHAEFGERRQVVTATLLAPVRVVVSR